MQTKVEWEALLIQIQILTLIQTLMIMKAHETWNRTCLARLTPFKGQRILRKPRIRIQMATKA